MTLILVGLNHQTAPVAMREQFYLADTAQRAALEALSAGGLDEAVIVSTCNRLEIYGWAEDVERAFDRMVALVEPLRANVYFRQDDAVARHLMRVASGIESLIPGETQILGQVGRALALAQAAGTDGVFLSRLFTAAIHAGKRARAETAISRYTLSASHAAVLLMKREMGDLALLRTLVIGAGEMAELAARALQIHGAVSICLMNRTGVKAEALAQRLGLRTRAWGELAQALSEYDVVITATSAPRPIIRREDIRQPALFVDIGVPRNVDDAVRALPGVRLYDIDDLRTVVEANRQQREAAVSAVEAIIAEEMRAYLRWVSSRQVVPLIVELRQRAEALAQLEVEQTLHRLPELNRREQEIVAQMAHRIVNKLLHTPTVTLKAQVGSGEYAEAIRQLFALEDERTLDASGS